MVSCFHSSGKCLWTIHIITHGTRYWRWPSWKCASEWYYEWFISICLMSGNTKPLVANDRVVLKTFIYIKCPATLRWARSWENTDDFCHIYIYIYIYIRHSVAVSYLPCQSVPAVNVLHKGMNYYKRCFTFSLLIVIINKKGPHILVIVFPTIIYTGVDIFEYETKSTKMTQNHVLPHGGKELVMHYHWITTVE